MLLNKEEKNMFKGGYGPTIRNAMEHLVEVGKAFGAERMVDVDCAHILSLEAVDLLYNLSHRMLDGIQVKIPTTTNPLALDINRARDLQIPQDIVDALKPGLERLTRLHQTTGMLPTYSCHPHSYHDLKMGEHVAFTEFNVAPLANSWFGVRTNLGGQTDALASAVTGKSPDCGLHSVENRWGEVLIEISRDLEPEKFQSSDFGALGYWAGQVLVDRIPVYNGLSKDMSCRQAEYMGVAQVLAGAIGMFHVVGVTPEAETVEAALGGKKPEKKLVFGKEDLAKAYGQLNTADVTKVDMVCLGCPHCPIEEVAKIARLLEGKKVAKGLRLWIGTSRPTYLLAQEMGFVDIIEGAGGFVLCNVCAGTGLLLRFTESLGVKVVANNGLTLCSLVSRRTRGKVGVCFGSTEQCVKAAVTGHWEEKRYEDDI